MSKSQGWGEPTNENLAAAAKDLWHADISKEKFFEYFETLQSNCDFLAVPEMNPEIFCRIARQATVKGMM